MKLLILFLSLISLTALSLDLKLPAEQRWATGKGLALGNGGVATVSDLSALQVNPANIAVKQDYEMSASYLWASYGRDVWRAGVKDSKSSQIAGAIVYTGFFEDYEPITDSSQKGDSAVESRISAAFASKLGKLNVGIGGDYVQAFKNNTAEIEKGVTFNVGLQMNIGKSIALGASAINLANKRFQNVSPQAYRAGISWVAGGLMVNFDYHHRERTPDENSSYSGLISEQLLSASAVFEYQKYIEVMGSYGKSVAKYDDLQLVGAGVGLKTDYFKLSYMVGWPNFSQKIKETQSVTASALIKL